MKFAIAILAAFALLLAGCAGSAQQGTPPAAAGGGQAAQAPGNDAIVQTPPGEEVPPPPAVPPEAQPPVAIVPTGMAFSEVALHNSESDCWVGYAGKVYDITNFMPNHKNYTELLVPLCGSTDRFEAAFEGKHGTSKVEVLISQSVLIGDLAQ